ncbi:MAG: HAD-IIIC family phosphatase [Oscillospiraceae bacterium]
MNALQYPFDGAEILQKKRALKKELLKKDGLTDKKIAIVTGSTVGDIRNILELFLLDSGIRPQFFEGGYGLYFEDVVFDDGRLANFAPDFLYVHTSVHNILNWPSPADSDETASAKLQAETQRLDALWDAAARLGCPVIVNNFEYPSYRTFGNMDAWDNRGRVAFVRALNNHTAARARSSKNFYIHDLCYLAASFGTDNWCDIATWYNYKYACSVSHIPDLCHSLAGIIKSLLGRTKKALTLDLDNTLWGGVIGEVGPEGIELGSETPTGLAYADFQRYLKMLAERGILLTVASKNETEPAQSGFSRADSPLAVKDFLGFEANWGPKSLSIEKISTELNILPESFVFMDDNPAERAEVTGRIPTVIAPPVGAPENSIALLDKAGYFETLSLSADDVKRNDMYRDNAERTKLQASAGDYTSYLKSLEMTAYIGPFADDQLERVTQLINKTNQFNLTTRRYTPAEVTACAQSASCITLAGRLLDRFGDNGLTSAIIATIADGVATIDLWIMSCRVFKRQFEYAMFDELVLQAKKQGVTKLVGHWYPTAKNLLVEDFYATIGFDLVQQSDNEKRFELDLIKDILASRNEAILVERT